MRHESDLPGVKPTGIDGRWLTSPQSQIEPAMAYQLGLPILILRETASSRRASWSGVWSEYMEFDPADLGEEYIRSPEWNGMLGRWERYVRTVVSNKGRPPALY